MLIKEKMWRGENLTAIRQEVAYHIKKAKKEYEQKQQQLVQQQQDGMMQQEQMKIQSEQAKAQMDAQMQMSLKAFEVAVARVTNNNKFIENIMTGENNGAERIKLERALKQVAMMGGLDKVDLALVYANVDMLEASMAQNAPQMQNTPV
jgi:superoxide dismutase